MLGTYSFPKLLDSLNKLSSKVRLSSRLLLKSSDLVILESSSYRTKLIRVKGINFRPLIVINFSPF